MVLIYSESELNWHHMIPQSISQRQLLKTELDQMSNVSQAQKPKEKHPIEIK